VLSAGGDFPAFNPADGVLTTLQLPPSQCRPFSDVAGLRAAVADAAASGSAVTHVPEVKGGAPAVDAVLPGNVLVNATLDGRAKLLCVGGRAGTGVAPLCEALGVTSRVKFVWAVPHDRFEDACRQRELAQFDGAAPPGLAVEQYLLRVPPPPWADESGMLPPRA
jgi:hypothetical protein